MRSRVGGTLAARAEPDVARPGLFRDRVCTLFLCWQALTRRPLRCLSTRPQVDGVDGRIQKVRLLHRVDACGLSNGHEGGHPFVGGGAPRLVANVGGRCILGGRGTLVFRRAVCVHSVRSSSPECTDPHRLRPFAEATPPRQG